MKKFIKWFLIVFALVVVYSLFANLYFSWKAQKSPQPIANNCSDFDNDLGKCKEAASCIPYGIYMRVYLSTGSEREDFNFKKCILREKQYAKCNELVQLRKEYPASSQFPVECRCCAD